MSVLFAGQATAAAVAICMEESVSCNGAAAVSNTAGIRIGGGGGREIVIGIAAGRMAVAD